MTHRAPFALYLIGAFAQAQPAPSLTIAQVLVEARAHRQELLAARSRADAAAQTPKVVSALPDPMLMGGLDHLPLSFMGANYSVQLQQDFPLSRLRAHREVSALREADARRAQASTTSLDVEVAAVRSFLMLVESQRMQAVIVEIKQLATQVHAAVQARVGAAQGSLSESVRAEVEVARMQGELDAFEREVAGAWAMTEASMGHTAVSAQIPVAELRTPTDAPPDLAALVAAATDRRPELAQMHASIEAARANVKVMESMYHPMAFVRVGAASTMLDGPGVMVMVGLTLPIWREKLGAGVDEATAMSTMAQADLSAMQTMVGGEVATGRERVLSALARFLATRDRVVPLSRQAAELTLNGYISGQQPLVSVLDAVRAQREAQMQSVRAEVLLAAAWVELSRSTGQIGVGP